MERRESNGSSSGGGSSRWNPTKEQISMLENLYKQGIRTPSAEQIQHITARLRAYGHIEGKNVFYWFQNHKARQRQKQKQESFAYFNRFLHHQPLFSPPLCSTAVLCAPYYMPHSEVGYYRQRQKILLPGSAAMRRMPRNGEMEERIMPDDHDTYLSNQETLQLFPLKPTGFLEDKSTVSADETFTASPDHIDEDNASPGNQPFYDFMRQ